MEELTEGRLATGRVITPGPIGSAEDSTWKGWSAIPQAVGTSPWAGPIGTAEDSTCEGWSAIPQ